jgi:hypothetical protein
MALIQFRVHPSVGMARIGKSKDWYFLGPEIPRFIQEQFANLRHRPQPLRHPDTANANAPTPDSGRYRDKSTPTPLIMPQAQRFRVFAYVYDEGKNEPDKVIELTTDLAEIEWTVTLANAKSVTTANSNIEVVPNRPGPKSLSTKTASPATNCQTDLFPNLGWLTLEKDAANKPTGRLHVIGNEGNINGGPYQSNEEPTLSDPFPPPHLFQYDWHDSAADGPVAATVELKMAFTSKFSEAKYLVAGLNDPVALPADGKIAALPAWVVVNLPDYVPDMGHFVSLWDLALNQAWNFTLNQPPKTAVGRHHLATASDLSSYAFYDYYVHIHPQLGLFSDVAHVSGQVRASAMGDTGFLKGVVLRGTTVTAAGASGGTIEVDVPEALRIKVASLDQPFLVLLSTREEDPLAGTHEFVRCSTVTANGLLVVDRAQEGTAAQSWPVGTHYFAGTKAGFVETPLLDSIPADGRTIKVDTLSAHRMPYPDERDAPFKIAVASFSDVEWMNCTANARAKGELAVERGVDGRAARPWGLLTDGGPVVVAPALGHKTLNARARADELAVLGGGAVQNMLYRRLRLPKTVYERKTFKRNAQSANTSFPREFGRRLDIEAVAEGATHSAAVNVDPGGSLTRFHEVFVDQRTKSCSGRSPLPPDAGKTLPAKLPDETYKEDLATHVTWLDDYFWIVSERDMPMLKELALTHMQFRHFQLWSNNLPDFDFNPETKHLFQRLFKPNDPNSFFSQPHSMEEYINELLTKRSRYAPAFLDMASMGKIIGGSFLPGIEVGREGGIQENWTLYHGGTIYFPDLRFHPRWNNGSEPHPPGMLTKDLSIPWFVDYIACPENYWPTSRPQVVYSKAGVAYSWLTKHTHANTESDLTFYWTKLGFIRRQPNDTFAEEESIFPRP